MASTNEEQKKAPVTKQESPKESPAEKRPAAPRNKSFMTKGSLLVSLGALAIALYTLWMNQQLQGHLADKNSELSTQLAQMEQKQSKSQELLDAKTNSVKETEAALQVKFEELNKQLQTAMSQRFYQNQNWILLKARYYLDLAQINAHWSENFSSTIALLQQADQLLQQLNDPKMLDVRQAIAKDIAQAQAVSLVDTAGILSQLDAAQTSLNDLNIPSTLRVSKSEEASPAAASKENSSVWRLRIQDSMNLLSKLVVIRRNDENIQPLISPGLEGMLKENIHLNLQEAQWAVLNNNPKVYQLVLNQAIANLKKNFNESATNTAALIKKLDELQKLELTQTKPDIGLALPLLNQIIESKEQQINQSSSDTQGGNS